MPTLERRNTRERASVTRRLINGLTENPSLTLTVDTLQAWLSVPHTAAQRILRNLATSGMIREIQTGVWVPSLPVQIASR